LVGLEDPDLALRPRVAASVLRPLDRLRAPFDLRSHAHRVASAAHLHAQRAVLDAGREVALDGDGAGAGPGCRWKGGPAGAPRHVELHARLHEERDAVLDAPEDLEAEALAFGAGFRPRLEPEKAALLAPRPRHCVAVERQIDETDLRGNAQRLRHPRPREAAG